MRFSTKVSFFPYIFGSFFPDLNLRTLEGRDATVTFVHQGRISMKGTVNVARSGREKKPGETETKTTGYLGEVGWNFYWRPNEAMWISKLISIYFPVYGNIYTCTYALRIMHKYVHVHVDVSLSLFCACSISLAAFLMSLSLSLFLPIFSLSFLLTCSYMILCSHILNVDRYKYFLWCRCVSVHTRRYAYGHLAFQ